MNLFIMTIKTLILTVLILGSFFIIIYEKEQANPDLYSNQISFKVPMAYNFTRAGASTVDLSIPAFKISMYLDLLDVMYDYKHSTLEDILNVWDNTDYAFDDPELNDFNSSLIII